jgi:hypothetical protein
MRQDHKAAEKLFVDYPGMTIPIYDERTLQVSFEAELFVAVLGASSYTFATATRSQRREFREGLRPPGDQAPSRIRPCFSDGTVGDFPSGE